MNQTHQLIHETDVWKRASARALPACVIRDGWFVADLGNSHYALGLTVLNRIVVDMCPDVEKLRWIAEQIDKRAPDFVLEGLGKAGMPEACLSRRAQLLRGVRQYHHILNTGFDVEAAEEFFGDFKSEVDSWA